MDFALKMNNAPHKFFEVYPDIDTKIIESYLQGVYQQMCFDGWFGEYSVKNDIGMVIDVTHKYNIFHYPNKEISTLLSSIRQLTKEACEYYGIDFDKQRYMIHGWFNLWKLLSTEKIEDKSWHFHDKVGAPNFHGYYCVNAEPSITHYRINGKSFDNINKNNRAILSETGHEHAPGDWLNGHDRITIAYDVLPIGPTINSGRDWIRL
jgi:hypothetical protein